MVMAQIMLQLSFYILSYCFHQSMAMAQIMLQLSFYILSALVPWWLKQFNLVYFTVGCFFFSSLWFVPSVLLCIFHLRCPRWYTRRHTFTAISVLVEAAIFMFSVSLRWNIHYHFSLCSKTSSFSWRSINWVLYCSLLLCACECVANRTENGGENTWFCTWTSGRKTGNVHHQQCPQYIKANFHKMRTTSMWTSLKCDLQESEFP